MMSEGPIALAINGAGGRMGRRVIALADQDDRFRVVCAIESPQHPLVGEQVGPVRCTDHLAGGADVVIDFSLPGGVGAVASAAASGNAALVIGTTGLDEAEQQAIDRAAGQIPIVQAANFSVGINLLLKLVGEAAAALGEDFDIEIVEAHHRFKQDAPSGTALALARQVCQATGKQIQQALRHGRNGHCPRQTGEIGLHAVRLGDTVGEHAIHFGSVGETVTLSHSAHTRDTFANGALRAAVWVAGRPPGKYDMHHVLFGA